MQNVLNMRYRVPSENSPGKERAQIRSVFSLHKTSRTSKCLMMRMAKTTRTSFPIN